MNNARLMSLLSEATDGAQYVSRRPKRKDDKEGYESDPLTKKMADVHTTEVTTEDDYPAILKHSKKSKQSRVGHDKGKNGDKSPNTIDPKYAKMGGHGSSTERPIDKKKINERLFSIIKSVVRR
jgi:hypothetical protein